MHLNPPRFHGLALLALVAATWLLAAAPTAAASASTTPAAAAQAPEEDPAGARVIVKYKALGGLMKALRAVGSPHGGPQYAATLAQRLQMPLRDGHVVSSEMQVVHGDRSLNSAVLAARLAADPDVEYAVPDLRRRAFVAPNDPLFAASATISPAAGQWYLRPPDATFVSAMNAEGAWSITTGSPSVVVADVDTGVLYTHPDLANKLLPGRNFVSTNGNGSGWSNDASDPGDWSTANQCGSGQAAEPSSWHGTQTSGLIGADTGNGIGMASVARQVMVLPVRVLGTCGGYDSDIIAGMLWAGGVSSNPVVNPTPARVINMSLGGSGSCPASYSNAINQLLAAGVVVVVAAGNAEGLTTSVPANCPGVIAVAALRNVGSKVGFSSIGPEVAISAPGGNCINTSGACLYPILTTTNTGTTSPLVNTYSDSSNPSLGTSFSTPLVSGTVALMLSANPALTPAQVKALIQSSARAFPTSTADPTVPQCKAPSRTVQDECLCTTSTCGAGMLDASAAVSAAAATALPSARISAAATTVLAGASLSFDASGSTAPSGRSIASYLWTISAGSNIATFTSGANGSTAAIKTTGIGSVTVNLTVTDSAGQQASATVKVTVNAPASPTVNLVSSTATAVAGQSVSFDGSGSQAASGLAIASYQWALTAGSNVASFSSATNGATATVATVGAASGTFTVRLTVTDSVGQSASASTTVSVLALGPTAAINAGAASVTAGSSVSLDGSGSTAPSGRSIAGYQWSITSGGGIAAISGSAAAPSVSIATSAAGSFTVQLTVTDSAGAQDTKTASVTVTAPIVITSSGGGGGGGGGGATNPFWLTALALAVLALRKTRPA